MALTKCPECNNTISDTAKICPHCGYEMRKTKSKQRNKNKLSESYPIYAGVKVAVFILTLLLFCSFKTDLAYKITNTALLGGLEIGGLVWLFSGVLIVILLIIILKKMK